MRTAAAISALLLGGSLTALAQAALAQNAASPGQSSIPMDTPTPIGGVETVCTGIGEQAQNPQWSSYPVRVEFSNGGAQYLSGAHVELASAGGRSIASLDCSGPMVLFRVPAGNYRVTATLMSQPGGTSSATVSAPRAGQKRVVLDFKVGANQ